MANGPFSQQDYLNDGLEYRSLTQRMNRRLSIPEMEEVPTRLNS